MSDDRLLLWVRTDLRRDDQPLVQRAAAAAESRFVYCFDDRLEMTVEPGIPRCGPARRRFLEETVACFGDDLAAHGDELVVRRGRPPVEVAEVARSWRASRVLVADLPGTEERADVEALTTDLARDGIAVERVSPVMLYDVDEVVSLLPETPDVFTRFRRKVEKKLAIPAPVDAPGSPSAQATPVAHGADAATRFSWAGGEAAGRQRLKEWIWEKDRLRTYKQTRNGMLDPDDASRLSAWLSVGALSPRRVAAEVRAYEAAHGASDDTYWLIFELLWRDYWFHLALDRGAWMYRSEGVGRRALSWRQDERVFGAWCAGETGVPLVDASMRELAETGFTSNRARQNVASFLTKMLGIDWRWGAAWYEAQLIDYDPYSNWGNWQYVAGVGTDPRDRLFDVVRQSERYDADGDYLRAWLPELAHLPAPIIHAPWRHPDAPDRPAGPMLDYDATYRRQRDRYGH